MLISQANRDKSKARGIPITVVSGDFSLESTEAQIFVRIDSELRGKVGASPTAKNTRQLVAIIGLMAKSRLVVETMKLPKKGITRCAHRRLNRKISRVLSVLG